MVPPPYRVMDREPGTAGSWHWVVKQIIVTADAATVIDFDSGGGAIYQYKAAAAVTGDVVKFDPPLAGGTNGNITMDQSGTATMTVKIGVIYRPVPVF